MVQITPTKVMSTAMPSGKSVPLVMVRQTSDEGVKPVLLLGLLVTPAGMAMRTVTRASMLNVDPYEFTRAIHLVGILLIPAWRLSSNTVSKNVCHAVGT